MAVYRIGWFSTGRDKAARQLLETVYHSIEQGEIEGEIALVFSNQERGEASESDSFFKLVESYRIPLVCYSYRRFKARTGGQIARSGNTLPPWRLEYDREVMRRLEGFPFELGVLAGYMLIVGKEICRRYNLINLHPAAPGGPTGTWQEVIWKLIESRAEETGVMMHYVTAELDKGPPVTYCRFPIRGKPFDRFWKEIGGQPVEKVKRQQGEANPLFRLIREHGLAREFPLIVATLKAFSQGRVRIEEGRVVDATGQAIPGYDLTQEIDRMVREKLEHI